MRDIKFRAWDKKEKKIWEVCGLEWCDEVIEMVEIYRTKIRPTISYREGVYDDEMNSKFILMQYTGLKDKNGKEIYEGDVLRRDSDGENYTFTITVRFGEGMFYGITMPGANYKLPAEKWGSCDSGGGGYDLVIGNIYENPELLTK